MAARAESLAERSSEQVAAPVERADDHHSGCVTRRDRFKSADAARVPEFRGSDSGTATTGSRTATTGSRTATTGSRTDQPRPGENEAEPSFGLIADGKDVKSIAAAPSKIQSPKAGAASNNGSNVVLAPTNQYGQPSEASQGIANIPVDWHRATACSPGDPPDTEIIHIYPGAQMHIPRIGLYNGGHDYNTSNSYQGRVIWLDTRWGSYFAQGTPILNGLINAGEDTGTGCYDVLARTRMDVTYLPLWFAILNPRNSNADGAIDVGVHVDTTEAGDDGWIDGVHINGHWRYVRTCVLQAGADGQRANQRSLTSARGTRKPLKMPMRIGNVKTQPGERSSGGAE